MGMDTGRGVGWGGFVGLGTRVRCVVSTLENIKKVFMYINISTPSVRIKSSSQKEIPQLVSFEKTKSIQMETRNLDSNRHTRTHSTVAIKMLH